MEFDESRREDAVGLSFGVRLFGIGKFRPVLDDEVDDGGGLDVLSELPLVASTSEMDIEELRNSGSGKLESVSEEMSMTGAVRSAIISEESSRSVSWIPSSGW